MAASSFLDDSEDFETEDPTPLSPPHKKIKIEPVDPNYDESFFPPPPEPLDYEAKIDEKGFASEFARRAKAKVERLLDFYSPVDEAELDSLIEAATTFLQLQSKAKISLDEIEDFFPLNTTLWKTLEEYAKDPSGVLDKKKLWQMRGEAELELQKYLDNPARLKSNTAQLFGFEDFFTLVFLLYESCCKIPIMLPLLGLPPASRIADILHYELTNEPTSSELKKYFANLEKCVEGKLNAGRNLILPGTFEYSFYAYLQIQLNHLRKRNPKIPKLFILETPKNIGIATYRMFIPMPTKSDFEDCLKTKTNMIIRIGALTNYTVYLSERDKDTPAIPHPSANGHAYMFTVRYDETGKPYITIHDPGNWAWQVPDAFYKTPEKIQQHKNARFKILIGCLSDCLTFPGHKVTPYNIFHWLRENGIDENSIINFDSAKNKDFPSYQGNLLYLSNKNCITITLWAVWWCCANIEKYFIQKQNLIEGFDFNNFPALHLFICYSCLKGKVPLTKEDLSYMYTSIKDFEDEGKHPRSIKTLVGSGQIPTAKMQEILAFVREMVNLKLKKPQNNLVKPPEDYNNPTKNSEFRRPVYNSVFNTLW